MTNEEFYDAQIAPALADLGRKCQERKMSFCCSVEYDPVNAGRGKTEYQAPSEPVREVSVNQLLVHWAMRADGNVDKLFIAVDKWARKHGHSSIYLQQLGNKNVRYSENESAAMTIIQQ